MVVVSKHSLLRSRVAPARRGVASCAVAASLAIARYAHAETPCEVRWTSAQSDALPSAIWADALHDVDRLVSTQTTNGTNCRAITVSPEGAGATVVFTTSDGREARRRIGDARELRPVVEALLVSVDAADVESPSRAASGSSLDVEGPPSDSARHALMMTSSSMIASDVLKDRFVASSSAPRLLVGAAAGAKQSWPGDTVAALGQVFGGFAVLGWEVAAFGRWETEHDGQSDARTRRLRYGAIGGGAMVGRREALGPVLLIAGVRAAVFSAEVEQKAAAGEVAHARKHDDEFVDPRIGLYTACIFAETSAVRMRVQVDGDAGLLVHRAEFASLAPFPRWNLGLSLGAEVGFFP